MGCYSSKFFIHGIEFLRDIKAVFVKASGDYCNALWSLVDDRKALECQEIL